MEFGQDTPKSPETPESQVVVFALEKLRELSKMNERGWGIINRARLSAAVKDVKGGKMKGSLTFLRGAVNRFEDLDILDSQLSVMGGYPSSGENPFRKKAYFFGAVAMLVQLDQIRRDVAEGRKDLRKKQEIENAVEKLLKGKEEMHPQLGQKERLLELVQQIKTEIWPRG